jgi:pSer/pThr/pTyr-binding forkhead associated (FHA) protein
MSHMGGMTIPTELTVTVTERDQVRHQYSFDACSVMVGRSAPCHIILDDPAVSRVHAEISLEHGTYYLNDLGSANGTTLNGVRQQRAPLRTDDVVAIGGFLLHIVISGGVLGSDQGSVPPRVPDRTIRTPGGRTDS